ncbi:glycosyl transferase [Anopheles sinensis]|uniref:Glycosyl transferase n=1 Tax=Anopheles sinensis TaxID=74873 RepID=A0A084WF76_ANOSI|nr:glycosyl transferase [Anopheles sinensis]
MPVVSYMIAPSQSSCSDALGLDRSDWILLRTVRNSTPRGKQADSRHEDVVRQNATGCRRPVCMVNARSRSRGNLLCPGSERDSRAEDYGASRRGARVAASFAPGVDGTWRLILAGIAVDFHSKPGLARASGDLRCRLVEEKRFVFSVRSSSSSSTSSLLLICSSSLLPPFQFYFISNIFSAAAAAANQTKPTGIATWDRGKIISEAAIPVLFFPVYPSPPGNVVRERYTGPDTDTIMTTSRADISRQLGLLGRVPSRCPPGRSGYGLNFVRSYAVGKRATAERSGSYLAHFYELTFQPVVSSLRSESNSTIRKGTPFQATDKIISRCRTPIRNSFSQAFFRAFKVSSENRTEPS